ncbi:hypothetical protein LI177_01680 [bacterium 210820-DFI.6.37]|nr:hypothetical protein [bacterium 210820-DFI.6.37]
MAKRKGSGEGSIFRYEHGWRGQLTARTYKISAGGKIRRDFSKENREKV